MFSRRSLPILLIVMVAGVVIAFKSLGSGNDNPPGRYEKILHTIGEMLTEIHYSPKDINDKFSKEVFKKFLVVVDQDKSIFLQSDITELKK